MRPNLLPFSLLLLALASPVLAAERVDVDADRFAASLAELDADPSLAELAGLERLKARQAVDALRVARSRDRAHALFIASRRVEAARVAAQAGLLVVQAQQLDRERDQLLIEASRREAEQARRESERLRLQSLAREEEAQRLLDSERLARELSAAEAVAATAEAEQARKLAAARAREAELARQEAELAAEVAADSMTDAPLPPRRTIAGGELYTLAGNAFASGRATLTANATASLRRLAATLARGSAAILITGHTDSQGADAANLSLSEQRAEAVRQVLADNGVAPGRLQALGKGESDPLADNASADGRARNRRVEILVK